VAFTFNPGWEIQQHRCAALRWGWGSPGPQSSEALLASDSDSASLYIHSGPGDLFGVEEVERVERVESRPGDPHPTLYRRIQIQRACGTANILFAWECAFSTKQGLLVCQVDGQTGQTPDLSVNQCRFLQRHGRQSVWENPETLA